MYNMDEKGFQLGVHNRANVIVRHRCYPPIEKMEGVRELTTVAECTYADNSMLPPMVIYKGKGLYRGWFTEVDDQDAKFAHSAKGYMTDKLAIGWLQAFDTVTKEHKRGQPRFLLMDSHCTHYSPKMIRYAVENNIIMMSYPGHSTHLLQPLDVRLFSQLQLAYKKQSPNIPRRLVLELPRLFVGGFLLKHDEKHILYKTSKHHGERRGLYHTILAMFSISCQLLQPQLRIQNCHPSIRKYLLH